MLPFTLFDISFLATKAFDFDPDPDAAAWFAAVEASGANFGPDPATANANKMAWSNWVVAQKNAESPISGKSNWDQLTKPDEGYIQPLMGLSTFNVPALFGASEFDNFVAGDYDPATGLRGGEGRGIGCGRRLSNTPANNVSATVILTGAPTSTVPSVGRVIGGQGTSFPDGVLNDGRVNSRNAGSKDTVNLVGVSTPRTIATSRHTEAGFVALNGEVYNFSGLFSSSSIELVGFLNNRSLNRPSDARIGLATYGRSINLEAMNTANIALWEAIVWP